MKGEQLLLGFSPLTALGREDFQVAACNADAVRWLEAWPNWPSHAVALWGPQGCGKTHLLSILAQRHGVEVIPARSLRQDDLPQTTVVLVDNLETPIHEESLFHLWNSVRERKGFLVMSSREAPARIKVHLPDLHSRLAGSLAVEIGRPDDSLLAAVLSKHFQDRQVRVSPDVIALVIARAERSFSAMQELAQALDQVALQQGRAITIPLARQVLQQLHEVEDHDDGP